MDRTDKGRSAPIRAFTRLAALAALIAAGWVAAPAISANPYIPETRNFEQPLGMVDPVEAPAARAHSERAHDAHEDEGAVTHISAVLDAPARFDLAGLAGEMRPVELRGRTEDGEWTDWARTANGDPVWFGGMDELQLRTRGYRPSGRIHYVNVSGDASESGGLLTGAREAINAVSVATASVLTADVALGADSTRPKVIRREAWGANRAGDNGCRPRQKAAKGKVKAAAIHHTVNAVNYSEAQAPGMVLGICQYHRNANGWDDIGYNVVVDRFGNIYEGRAGGLGKPLIGAHAQGVNYRTTGVAVLGTHSSVPAGRKAVNAISRWLAWKLPKHGVRPRSKVTMRSQGGSVSRFDRGEKVRTKTIFGHRVVNFTECPGDALNGQLAKIRRKTQKKMQQSADSSSSGDGGSGAVGR